MTKTDKVVHSKTQTELEINSSKNVTATSSESPLDIKKQQGAQSNGDAPAPVKEVGGPKGLEPTRYGDWESKGRCYDF